MKIVTVEQIRQLDREAVEVYGISEEILMENAGASVVKLIEQELGVEGRSFVVVSGTGNNGGDGFVVARHLWSRGGEVEVFVVGNMERIKGVAKTNLERLEKIGIPVTNITNSEDIDLLEESIEEADAVIDALFGTGISREVTGVYREVIESINALSRLVFSVDIPSGINGNNGMVMGVAVRADYTVTFGLPKLGNILYPGFDYCGELYVSYISYPRELIEKPDLGIETNDPIPLPRRKPDGHKGEFGKALFVAGSAGYLGAPYFASMSFLKAGGGYSVLATSKSIVPFLGSKASEVVYIPLEETETGSIAYENLEQIVELSERADIVVVGPGLSLNEETQRLVVDLLARIEKPVIVDGDGITAVAKRKNVFKERKHYTILTPHLGEMSRLTGLSIDEIKENRVKVLVDTCKELDAIIVLKGAHSLIGTPDGRVYVNMTGNSGLATAGSGDVLTGTIAAMYGLGLNIVDAVRMGVFVHGLAGDIASYYLGEDGVTASSILESLPFAVYSVRELFDDVYEIYSIGVL